MSFGLTEIITLATFLGGLATLGVGIWRMRLARQPAPSVAASAHADIITLMREGEERLTSMVALMEANHHARLDGLRQDISSVKADIDWLTGERMIEQAISMAREGLPAEQISEDLGLSYEAARTIAVMRRH